MACHVQWKTALDQKYPHLGDRSRPVRTQEDRTGLPSVETYTRAELQTYSPRTISLYHAATMKRIERGENEAEENLLNQAVRLRESGRRGTVFQYPRITGIAPFRLTPGRLLST